MYGTYNTSTDEIEIYNLDLAQYQKSQYPIIDQETVKETLIAWGDFYHEGMKTPYSIGINVSAPKLVYLENKNYYVPALQFLVDTSKTSLQKQPKVLYVQLVK